MGDRAALRLAAAPNVMTYSTASSAFTMPAPKKEFWPGPPTQRSSLSGHGRGEADEASIAATALPDRFGKASLISAATPAACGDAIDVPLIHT